MKLKKGSFLFACALMGVCLGLLVILPLLNPERAQAGGQPEIGTNLRDHKIETALPWRHLGDIQYPLRGYGYRILVVEYDGHRVLIVAGYDAVSTTLLPDRSGLIDTSLKLIPEDPSLERRLRSLDPDSTEYGKTLVAIAKEKLQVAMEAREALTKAVEKLTQWGTTHGIEPPGGRDLLRVNGL